MIEGETAQIAMSKPRRKKKKAKGGAQALWWKIRRPLAQSRYLKGVLTALFLQTVRFIRWTNPVAKGSSKLFGEHAEHEPGIIALWHGQHLLAPAFYPNKRKLVAMVSRSADAELNAMVLERLGIEAVRGSGGRLGRHKLDKGGASALIALKKALDAGSNVCMIADIPHGKPREAGMGVILLARLSGRPIAPAAMATSRRKVLQKTWDKTTINLPFGRCALVSGPLIHVAPDADEAEMERKRQELTIQMNAATAKAYRIADGAE
jgi:lysophospholipid acyltransferase (LPLAT)-like uncharacterized protein